MTVHRLKALDLVVGSPVLGTPTLRQIHKLAAEPLAPTFVMPPQPPPPGHGTLEAGVEWATLTLWPGARVPDGLKPRERNSAIHDLLKSHGYTLSANGQAFERAVQHVFRKLRGLKQCR